MENQTLLPVVSLLLGWLLSEASQLMRRRSQRVEAINQTMSELLELRNRVHGYRTMYLLLADDFKLPAQQINQAMNHIPEAIRVNQEVSKRFNDAVSNLAKFDPFLAYELRSKDVVGVAHSWLQPDKSEDQSAHDFADQQWRELDKMLFPVLDEAVVRTSRAMGIFPWIRARAYIAQSSKMHPDLAAYIERFKKALQSNALPTST